MTWTTTGVVSPGSMPFWCPFVRPCGQPQALRTSLACSHVSCWGGSIGLGWREDFARLQRGQHNCTCHLGCIDLWYTMEGIKLRFTIYKLTHLHFSSLWEPSPAIQLKTHLSQFLHSFWKGLNCQKMPQKLCLNRNWCQQVTARLIPPNTTKCALLYT